MAEIPNPTPDQVYERFKDLWPAAMDDLLYLVGYLAESSPGALDQALDSLELFRKEMAA